jgi:predicted dinucleotide-binding enzyme
MKIAVIGTGRLGASVGKALSEDHDVTFGSRDPDSDSVHKLIIDSEHGAAAAEPEVATQDADVVVLAVPWEVAEETVTSIGDLEGKILADCTNPLTDDLTGLVVGTDDSAAERIARAAPGARVVKAFSTTGSGNIDRPELDPETGERVQMFYCGDDGEAKDVIAGLIQDMGMEPVDCGALFAARYLEALAGLWVHLAHRQSWGPNFTFQAVRRDG